MFFTHNGKRLYYHEIGSGEPIFILHGGPGLSHEYLLPHLLPLAKDFKLYFLDFSYHGQSDDEKGLTLRKMAEEVEGLRRYLNLSSITLLGHSMGGFVAQIYASVYSSYLSRLILVGTGAKDPHPIKKVWKSMNVKDKWKFIRFIFTNLPGLLKGTAKTSKKSYRIIGHLYVKNKRYQKDVIGGYIHSIKKDCISSSTLVKDFSRIDLTTNKGKVNTPTLVICGDGDLIMRDMQDELTDTYPHALMQWLDSGHDPFMEDAPGFLEIVRQFVKDPIYYGAQ